MRISFIIATLFIAAACTGASNGPAAREDGVQSPGKPRHPIQVRAVVDGPLKAGVETGATLIVTSSRPVESVEVILQPELATVLSESRFERRVSATQREATSMHHAGARMDFGFRVRPASDAPQPVRVLVRVTGPDGGVLTREVRLPLSGEAKSSAQEKPGDVEAKALPEPEGDAVVPATQEIRREPVK